MRIEKENLCTLWNENEHGKKFIPDLTGNMPPHKPKGFIYQHSMFPTHLYHNVLREVVTKEVEKCKHHEENIRPTDGWIEGIEGRECKKCMGSQTRNAGQPWPEKWEANGSRKIMTGEMGWCEDLALAMATKIKPKSLRDSLFDFKKFTLSEAILITATCCEACMNVLRYHYLGKKEGYKEGSDEWKKVGTTCSFCNL